MCRPQKRAFWAVAPQKTNYCSWQLPQQNEHKHSGKSQISRPLCIYTRAGRFAPQVRFWGSSGQVSLDSRGERRDISVEVRQLVADGSVHSVGSWTTRSGLMWRGAGQEGRHAVTDQSSSLAASIKAKKGTLRITTVLVSFRASHSTQSSRASSVKGVSSTGGVKVMSTRLSP